MAATLAGERSRLARMAVVWGAMERFLGTPLGAARVALLAWSLTTSDYGLYITVLGVISTAGFVDFGLHYGLVNAVAAALGRDDRLAARSSTATAFVIYCIIATASLALVVPFASLAPMRTLLGVSPEQVGAARTITLVGFGGALLAMPLRVFHATLIGQQVQHVVAAFRSIAGLIQFAVMGATVWIWRGSVVALVASTTSADLLCLVAFGLWAARHGAPLDLRAARRPLAGSLVSSSFIFFVTNVANFFKRTAVTVVISHALGPKAVPSFSVPLALFTIALGLSDLLAGSLWPAYGEAAAREDWDWVRRAFRTGSTAAMLVAGLAAALGAAAGDDVIRIWTPKIPVPSHGLFVWLAVWLLGQGAIATTSALLCGLNRNRLLMWITLAEGSATIGLSAHFVGSCGIEAVGACMGICSVLAAGILASLVVPRVTGGMVFVEGKLAVRILASILASSGAGWLFRATAAPLPVVARVTVVGAATATVYAVVAWQWVLSADERTRLTAVLGRRFGHAHIAR